MSREPLNTDVDTRQLPKFFTVQESQPATIGYYYFINCMVGTGVLGLPWAFQEGGWVASLWLLLFFGIMSQVLSSQMLDSMARMEVVGRLKSEGIEIPQFTVFSIFKRQMCKMLNENSIRPEITARKYDLTEMIDMLYDKHFSRFIFFSLWIELTLGWVNYWSIFAASLASSIPLGFYETCNIYKTTEFFTDCRVLFWIWLFIFYLCMLYFVLKGLSEQAWMQMTMALLRFVVIISMVGTCIGDLVNHTENSGTSSKSAHFPAEVNFINLGKAFPVVCFAVYYQQNLPSITQFIANKDKTLGPISYAATATVLILFTAIGMILPLAIDDLEAQSTLSWRGYSAGYSDRPWWTYFFEYLILIFPAFDVFSGYPIINNVLSDNIFAVIFKTNENNEISSRMYYSVRGLTCTIPFIICFFFYNLSTILGWAGFFHIATCLIAIPMISIVSRRLVSEDTAYTSKFTNLYLAYFVAILGTCCFFIIAVALIANYITGS